MAAQGINARTESAVLDEVRSTPLDLLARSSIKVGDDVVHAGRLSLNQLIALAQIIVDASARLAADKREVLLDAAKTDGELADIAAALAVLDERTVTTLVGTVIGRAPEWTGEHLGALELLQVADAVLEHNDIAQVRAVFFRLVGRLKSSRS